MKNPPCNEKCITFPICIQELKSVCFEGFNDDVVTILTVELQKKCSILDTYLNNVGPSEAASFIATLLNLQKGQNISMYTRLYIVENYRVK